MKKKIIAAIGILLVLLIAVRVIADMDFIKDDNIYVEPEKKPDGDRVNNGALRDLYEADWETDIFTLQKYLDKNPQFLKYGLYNGDYVEYSESLSTRSDCFAKGGSALAMMYDYFESVKRGDHEAVNGYYTDDYFDPDENGDKIDPYNDFPMQKIYDLFIRKYDYVDKSFENSEHEEPTYYIVTYKIMENDGLYRYEVDADCEIPQLFGVITYSDGSSRIYMVMDLPGFTTAQ